MERFEKRAEGNLSSSPVFDRMVVEGRQLTNEEYSWKAKTKVWPTWLWLRIWQEACVCARCVNECIEMTTLF